MNKEIIVYFIITFLTGCYWPIEPPEKRPAAPSELTATIKTEGGVRFIQLQWKDNSNNETGFKIARNIGTGMHFVIQSVGANTTLYNDYPPITEYGTTYGYKVRSITNYYSSEYSNDAVITFK
jgi:trimeric autotransporter adhesin